MNYDDPSLRDHLAAEYALGTLRGRARRRFERLMEGDPALRELTGVWETRLNPLAAMVKPVPPPATTWSRIEARLGPEAAPRLRPARARPRRSWRERLFARPATPVPSLATAGMWYCVAFWRTTGLIATAAAAALALYLVGAASRPGPLAPTHLAVLTGAETVPALVARLDTRSGRVEVEPVGLPAPAPDTALELWLLPPGGAPRSLGLLGDSGLARELPAADAASLAAAALAVSREPAGGSPTGLPTGPVLYKGAVVPASNDAS